MNCPFCGAKDTRVCNSRASENRIRRRRECTSCGKRFTTYEVPEQPLLMVKKRDGSIEPFNRNKLRAGILNAMKKRPVTSEQITHLLDEIENMYADEMRSVVTSAEIGNAVMEKLKDLDVVAYIRFASVYQDFSDVESFLAIIGALGDDRVTQNAETAAASSSSS